MSLQDDIFDIRDTLKDTPEAKAFERVEEALSRYENAFHRSNATLAKLRAGASALAEIWKESQ